MGFCIFPCEVYIGGRWVPGLEDPQKYGSYRALVEIEEGGKKVEKLVSPLQIRPPSPLGFAVVP